MSLFKDVTSLTVRVTCSASCPWSSWITDDMPSRLSFQPLRTQNSLCRSFLIDSTRILTDSSCRSSTGNRNKNTLQLTSGSFCSHKRWLISHVFCGIKSDLFFVFAVSHTESRIKTGFWPKWCWNSRFAGVRIWYLRPREWLWQHDAIKIAGLCCQSAQDMAKQLPAVLTYKHDGSAGMPWCPEGRMPLQWRKTFQSLWNEKNRQTWLTPQGLKVCFCHTNNQLKIGCAVCPEKQSRIASHFPPACYTNSWNFCKMFFFKLVVCDKTVR